MLSQIPVNTLWDEAISNLRKNELLRLNSCFHVKEYKAGELLFSAGEIGTAVYVVGTGQVRLYYLSGDGEEFTQGVWASGHVMGLISTLLQKEYSVFAVCHTQAKVKVLCGTNLFELMHEIPQFSFNISKVLARMANRNLRDRGLFALDSAVIRVIRVMLNSIEMKNDKSHNNIYTVDLSQDELAKMVGVGRPWINKILSGLEDGLLILRGRRQIQVLDLYGLLNLVGKIPDR